MSGKDDVRGKIIEAARKRFSHFGYSKTTMAEVAADCSMSPGNLYRFFPGKLDIAEAIATDDYEKHHVAMRKLALNPDKPIRERLRDILLAELRRNYHRFEKDPRAYDMARVIAHERPDFANWVLASERKVLVEMLEETERRGEFQFSDKEHVAEMIQWATMKFRHPILWTDLTLPQLERELDGVLELLVNGVCPEWRKTVHAAA